MGQTLKRKYLLLSEQILSFKMRLLFKGFCHLESQQEVKKVLSLCKKIEFKDKRKIIQTPREVGKSEIVLTLCIFLSGKQSTTPKNKFLGSHSVVAKHCCEPPKSFPFLRLVISGAPLTVLNGRSISNRRSCHYSISVQLFKYDKDEY